MKKKKKKKVYKLPSLILLGLSFLLVGLLFYLNVLPTLYLILIVSFILVTDLILWFFLVCPKIKKSIKIKSLIISIVLIIIYLLGDFYLLKTVNFLSDIISSNNKIVNYSVLVKKDSSYNEIEDLRNKKMGYYKLNESVNDKIEVSVDFDPYTNLINMFDDLLNDEIDSLIIDDSLMTLVEEEDNNLSTKTKVIFTISVEEEADTTAKAVNTTKESFNIYLSGIDTFGNIASVSRSDVNIIATINPNTRKVLLTSIPRDYYVQLYGKTGYKDKLTHAGIYGVETSIGTIEELLNIDINYYVKVNFTSLIDIVNILDGVTVYSDYAFTSIDGYTYVKGNNTMYGEKTLSFARERHAFEEGDRQRGKNQEEVIKAIIDKVTSPSIITKYDSLLSKVSSKVQTNMPQKDMLAMVKAQLSDNREWVVESNNLDGSNGFEYTYSYSTQKLYVMIPDTTSVENAKNMIKLVSDGNE